MRSLKSLIGFESKSFALLWRGTRDGSGPSAFHRHCDGKPNTLTVIKNSLGYVFGGYSTLLRPGRLLLLTELKSNSTAFLFSLTNPANNPLKLKVIQPEYAVIHHSSWGPLFGLGNDLWFHSFDSSDNRLSFSSYQSPNGLSGTEGGKYVLGGSTHFYIPLEIEVFQVV